MFKDETGLIVPAIVSESLWDAANAILKRRSDDVKSRQGICNHANLLTGKLYCTHCGAAYYRRESTDKNGNKNSRWVCSGKIKNGADSCPSLPIYESEIKPLLLDVARDTRVSTEALVEEYVQRFQAMEGGEQLQSQMEQQKTIIDLTRRKKSKLLEYNVTGQISDADFLAMNRQCDADIQEAEEALGELESRLCSKEEFREKIHIIRTTLKNMELAAASGAITKDFVEEFIDKIYVTPEEGGVMQLDIRIFTGEQTRRYFEKLVGSTGHISKKMIEAYEQGMQ